MEASELTRGFFMNFDYSFRSIFLIRAKNKKHYIKENKNDEDVKKCEHLIQYWAL